MEISNLYIDYCTLNIELEDNKLHSNIFINNKSIIMRSFKNVSTIDVLSFRIERINEDIIIKYTLKCSCKFLGLFNSGYFTKKCRLEINKNNASFYVSEKDGMIIDLNWH